MKSIYNIPLIRSQTTTAITPLGNLTDVDTSGVQNADGLVYNAGSSKWTAQHIVNSFNARTGSVLPANNDYSISQITNSSTLADSANVNIAGPTDGQFLIYSAGKWINSTELVALPVIYNSSLSAVNVDPNNYYTNAVPSCVFTITNNFVVGDRVIIASLKTAPLQINMINSQFIGNTSTAPAPTNVILMHSCIIELIYITTNTFSISNINDVTTDSYLTYNGDKYSAVSNLGNIKNVVLTGPSSGQALFYNGTNWVNSSAVVSVDLAVPSEFTVSGGPITGSGTLTVSKVNQLQNLVYASPDGSTGAPSFRSLVYNDLPVLPYQNIFYNVIESFAGSINPAVANTHYIIENNCTITVNPLNVGEHLRVSVSAFTATINFTGTSFILNWNSSGGISNPSIVLSATSIELVCYYNSGQTYYYLTEAKQSSIGADHSTFTIGGTKQSALATINNLPDVVITGPSTGQRLEYNAGNWVNSFGTRIYNSAGLITSPKVWVGSDTTSGSGIFSVNISSAGFTNIYSVTATAFLAGSNNSNAPLASLRSISPTTVTGLCVESTTIVLGGEALTDVSAGILVYITVVGN